MYSYRLSGSTTVEYDFGGLEKQIEELFMRRPTIELHVNPYIEFQIWKIIKCYISQYLVFIATFLMFIATFTCDFFLEITVKPLYFAPHLIVDFRELTKIVKFNGRENDRKYVKL